MNSIFEAFTLYIMPFRINAELDSELAENELWKPACMKMEKGVFYNHIQHFMQSSLAESGAKPGTFDWLVYSLDRENSDVESLLGTSFTTTIKRNDESREVIFRIGVKARNFEGPKLILCPTAGVGLLMFSVILPQGQLTIDNLMDLNYYLHKSNFRQDQGCYVGRHIYPNSPIEWRGDSINDLTIDKLSQMLMGDLAIKTERVNLIRFHLFTFLHAECDDDEMIDNFVRLMSCQNKNYQVLNGDEFYVRSFKNIYMGSTQEGGGIMLVAPKGQLRFFDDFGSTSLHQHYLWIYLMALMQRHTLLHLAMSLSDDNIYNRLNVHLSLSQLRKMMERHTGIRNCTWFSEVSEHRQHNQFFRLCQEHLSVNRLMKEVDVKIESLNHLLENLSDKRKERIELAISVLLAILALTSSTSDGLNLIDKIIQTSWLHLILFFFGLSMACWGIWKLLSRLLS